MGEDRFPPLLESPEGPRREGIAYELVPGPQRAGKRTELEQLSGQRKYPVIEFEDGSVYREESKDMAAGIDAGELFDGSQQS